MIDPKEATKALIDLGAGIGKDLLDGKEPDPATLAAEVAKTLIGLAGSKEKADAHVTQAEADRIFAETDEKYRST